jgi:hypothetical protein
MLEMLLCSLWHAARASTPSQRLVGTRRLDRKVAGVFARIDVISEPLRFSAAVRPGDRRVLGVTVFRHGWRTAGFDLDADQVGKGGVQHHEGVGSQRSCGSAARENTQACPAIDALGPKVSFGALSINGSFVTFLQNLPAGARSVGVGAGIQLSLRKTTDA